MFNIKSNTRNTLRFITILLLDHRPPRAQNDSPEYNGLEEMFVLTSSECNYSLSTAFATQNGVVYISLENNGPSTILFASHARARQRESESGFV